MTTCLSQQWGVYNNDIPLPGDTVIPDRPSINYEYINGSWTLNKAYFNASIYAQISALELTQARPLREVALNIAGAADRVTAINNEIIALRAKLMPG